MRIVVERAENSVVTEAERQRAGELAPLFVVRDAGIAPQRVDERNLFGGPGLRTIFVIFELPIFQNCNDHESPHMLLTQVSRSTPNCLKLLNEAAMSYSESSTTSNVML